MHLYYKEFSRKAEVIKRGRKRQEITRKHKKIKIKLNVYKFFVLLWN